MPHQKHTSQICYLSCRQLAPHFLICKDGHYTEQRLHKQERVKTLPRFRPKIKEALRVKSQEELKRCKASTATKRQIGNSTETTKAGKVLHAHTRIKMGKCFHGP